MHTELLSFSYEQLACVCLCVCVYMQYIMHTHIHTEPIHGFSIVCVKILAPIVTILTYENFSFLTHINYIMLSLSILIMYQNFIKIHFIKVLLEKLFFIFQNNFETFNISLNYWLVCGDFI